ncbi:conserved hypothetical protein [Roseobacter sp. GAI101]|nr:SnoaL-like domain-containing protein [Roseobacter sp. GAI101]EEB83051.1 conserved hypothetical protein [Roseobacter sp. GAI101]
MSIEAVVPPGRDVRIAKGQGALEAKREDWAATHEIYKLDADGPYVHPPDRFNVHFEVEVAQKSIGRKMNLREISTCTVEEGKIAREEFFMMPK